MDRSKRLNRLQKPQIPQWGAWYILFMVVVVVWHLIMREYTGDSVNHYSTDLNSDTLINTLKNEYATFTSRIIVDAALLELSRHVTLWKICNVMVYALLGFSFLRLTDFRYPQLLLGLWLTYPVLEMSSAGWIATYMNYLWPVAFGAYALTGLDKISKGKKFYKFEWITFPLAAVYAANVQQGCVALILILIGFGVDYYLIRKSRNGHLYYALLWAAAIGNLALIAFCPGTYERTWGEVRWMHEFGMFSIIDKGVLGVTATMNPLVTGNLNFFLFVTAIFALGLMNRRYGERETNNVKRVVIEVCNTAPFVFTVMLTVLKDTSSTYFAKMLTMFSTVMGDYSENTSIYVMDAANWNNCNYYMQFIVYMLLIIAIIVSLLTLFSDDRKNIELGCVFLIGLITRVTLGFSPTLHASSMRTFIFFDAIIIFSIVRMFMYSEELREKLPKMVRSIASRVWIILLVLSVINNTICVASRR